jgi:hypothetical protein
MSCSSRRISTRLGLLTLFVTLLVPAAAQAQIVTVGSPLTGTYGSTTIGPSANPTQTTLITSSTPEAGAKLTSPISGVIVRWRITQAVGTFSLRVLTPNGGQSFTGGVASSPQTPQSTATQVYTTNLPIKAGQTIGLDDSKGDDKVGFLPGGATSTFSFVQPKIGNGETRTAFGPSSSVGAVGFNADVATIPSNDFDFGSVKKNKNKGTALLTVDVPGPGKLDLSGAGVKPQRSLGGARVSKDVDKAGPVTLKIKAKGAKKAKLASRGKVKVKVNVTFTPAGDAPGVGVPNTEPKKIKLVDN